MADEWTAMGVVKSVNPRKRTIRVKRATLRTPKLEALNWVRIQLNRNEPTRCRVALAREHGDCVDLTFTAGVPQDLLAGLRGAAVEMPLDALMLPREDAWQMSDLDGMNVVDDATGDTLGVVTDFFETSINAALVIESEGKPRMLIPAIPEVILLVDLDAKEIRVGDLAPFMVSDED